MSRADYSYDIDSWELIMWRGQVASAIRGKRGQALLRDLVTALDALPEKSLTFGELETEGGEVCALGAVGKLRGIDMKEIDPSEPDVVAGAFDVAEQLAREIVHQNDEGGPWKETPEQRWQRMREWAVGNLKAGAVV